MAAIDFVDWPSDQPLRISGAPGSLRAPVTIAGGSEQALGMAQASLVDVKGASGGTVAARSIGVAGGQIRIRLDALTAPGRYEGRIEIGGAARPIQIDVVETVALSIRPTPLIVDLALGREQRVSAAFENRGNISLTIDVTGEYPFGEELPIFPERIDRAESDALGRIVDLFARTIGGRAQRAMREAGRVTLAMPDGPIAVEPGATRTIAVNVALPEGLSPASRYRAFVPVYATDFELVAITAAKRATPKERPRARNRGVST